MQHPGQGDVATPLGLAGDFAGSARHRKRCPDDLVLTHGFHRRIARDDETIESSNAAGRVDVRKFASDRDLQIELLTLHQFPITDTRATTRYHSVSHSEISGRQTKLRRG